MEAGQTWVQAISVALQSMACGLACGHCARDSELFRDGYATRRTPTALCMGDPLEVLRHARWLVSDSECSRLSREKNHVVFCIEVAESGFCGASCLSCMKQLAL